MNKRIKNILVTGASGQIGSELTEELRKKYGSENVIASDCKIETSEDTDNSGPFHIVNVNDKDSIEKIVRKYNIDTVVHLAAILSAVGEKNPQRCWDVNINGTINILELGIQYDMARIIMPSSIAVWGGNIPRVNTPQDSVLKPSTMYGVTKVCGEQLCDYYVSHFGLDIRGLRYPGIISHKTLPGGGTTDYAVAIYYEAIDKGKYTCFVKENTKLPMIYMPDVINGTIKLMEADFNKLNYHSNYNFASMSFTVSELADSIKKHVPDFEVTYKPDYRQDIADSWPNSVDDCIARQEWGWIPEWDLDAMTEDMLKKLKLRKELGILYGKVYAK